MKAPTSITPAEMEWLATCHVEEQTVELGDAGRLSILSAAGVTLDQARAYCRLLTSGEEATN